MTLTIEDKSIARAIVGIVAHVMRAKKFHPDPDITLDGRIDSFIGEFKEFEDALTKFYDDYDQASFDAMIGEVRDVVTVGFRLLMEYERKMVRAYAGNDGN